MDKYYNTIRKIKEFNEEREWDQFHTPKNIAISISLEANELLEFFQWDSDENIYEKLKNKEYRTAMKDEIGDICNYLFVMCDKIGIDLLDAVNEKLEKNKMKYPVDKCKGKADKYTAYESKE